MAQPQRGSRGGSLAANLVGFAIIVGLLLTPGTQRLAGTGARYLDANPATPPPLLAGLAVFLGIAVGLQRWRGFVVSAVLGAVAGGVLFLALYAPARWALPWFGPDQATCPAGQVLDTTGTSCLPAPARKAAHR